MKAAPFSYVRAQSTAEACRHLAHGGDDARLLAGGQTLIPMMAMRLVRPALLIDLNPVAELAGIARAAPPSQRAELCVGALTRQSAAAASRAVRARVPLLADALAEVGHPPTRARGTIGGSLANADPAAEIALAAQTLGAVLVAVRAADAGIERRAIPASDFFAGPLETTLAPDECLAEVRFPDWLGQGGGVGSGFAEVAVRDGDFAVVAAAAQVQLEAGGRCLRAAFGVANAAPVPLAADAALAADFAGRPWDDGMVEHAAHSFTERLDPPDDAHASALYRRSLVPILLARALTQAGVRALTGARALVP